ncbi:MAG: hypothetical protein FWF86_09335, partial [Clostridia bacterium]|nr:hypothetical protein [Clostridia bacterium]
VVPREDIVEAVKRQLDKGKIRDKLIHLCFTCDPYPIGLNTRPTREIIKAIKQSGNHVQILTKGGCRALRDFDLLDGGDWFGVTVTNAIDSLARHNEPYAAPTSERLEALRRAKLAGINTWVSCEPVYDPPTVYQLIMDTGYIDLYRIGKLNYAPSRIDWGAFGRECERICRAAGRDYYIKQDLRKEMERA